MTHARADASGEVTNAEFARYRRTFVDAMRLNLREHPDSRLHYAALPAYAHRNPFIRFVFWQRIRSVMRYLKGRGPWRSVLDFGCGAGVLVPFFAQRAERIVAADVDMSALHAIARSVPLARNVDVLDLGERSLSDLAPKSCELIVALDVLEHVGDLASTARALERVLATGGEIIVSGPTENVAYRLGRRIAGRDFRADYHVRNIRDVRRELAATFDVRPITTMFHGMPLFITYSVMRPVHRPSSR